MKIVRRHVNKLVDRLFEYEYKAPVVEILDSASSLFCYENYQQFCQAECDNVCSVGDCHEPGAYMITLQAGVLHYCQRHHDIFTRERDKEILSLRNLIDRQSQELAELKQKRKRK